MGGHLSKLTCCTGSPEPTDITFPCMTDPIGKPHNQERGNENSFDDEHLLEVASSVKRYYLSKAKCRTRRKNPTVRNRNAYPGDTKDDESLPTIFPQEVWYMILDKISAVNDQENLSNSSQYFRRLLEPIRHQFLFPKVVKLLLIYFPDDYPESEVDSDDDFDDRVAWGDSFDSGFPPGRCNSCGRKLKTDWHSEFLKLRLICQNWCETIDNMFQNQSPHCTNRDEEMYCYGFNQMARVEIDVLLDPYDILAHFEETHGHDTNTRCPFLGRVLRFYVTNLWFENPDGIIDFLLKYGRQIHHATIIFQDNYQTGTAAYSKMTLVLGFLPNLITLEFQYIDFQNRVMSYEGQADEILLNPMPTIGTLASLTLFNLSPRIFNELLQRNNHISTLVVQRHTLNYYYYIDIVPLPNLTQFSMEFYSDINFERLEEVNWPLEKLDLEFKRDMFIPWNKIFDLIERKWMGSLTNLRLALPKATSEEETYSIIMDSFHLRLNLAAVETLTLEVQNYCFLDFILGMKDTLTHLSVTIKCGKRQHSERKMMKAKRRRQAIQFYGHFHKLYQSNIWRMFPRLQTFEFKGPDGKQLKFCKRRMNVH